MRRSLPALLSVAVLAAVAHGADAAPLAPVFARNVLASATVGRVSEPSAVTAADGTRYVAYQGGGSHVVRAKPDGAWTPTGFDSFDAARPREDRDVGDVAMAADRAGTVFNAHLSGPLQGDIDYSSDGGSTWRTAISVFGRREANSMQPLGVDRPWIATYSPTTNAADTRVYLEYHDFGPSTMWVVPCSMATGDLVCGASEAASGPESFCNTIPGQFQVAPPGSPHAGRVYTVWLTADPVENAATGCNLTELAPFNSVYVSYSDNADAGASATWHLVPVFVGEHDAACAGRVPTTGGCDDNSDIFPHLAVDNGGTVYVTWEGYLSSIDRHYDVYLSSSRDGGDTWNGAADGTGVPIRVDTSPGIEVMPAIVAGDAGRVALAWVGTDYDDQPYTAHDTCPSNFPPEFTCAGKAKPEPPSAAWHVYVAQSLNAASSRPRFTIVRASDAVVHYGDFCNIGIYCDGSSTGNRSLLDNIALFTDAGGYLQVAWTDQRTDRHGAEHAAGANAESAQSAYDAIEVACQNAGPSLLAHPAARSSCAGTALSKRRR